jgi:hypothetical protein
MTRIAMLASAETHDDGDGTLYRALRADAPFAFAAIGGAAGPDYEVVREHGTPDREGGVVLITPFEVAPDADDDALAGWDSARDSHARQQGYLGARLYRSLGAAEFRFVELARWSSPLMVQRARGRAEFQAAALPFRSHPALYLTVT